MGALMKIASLPYVDEHTTVVEAEADAVWQALTRALERFLDRPKAAGYARLVGADYLTASGPRPLAERSRFPGFLVTTADPPHELVLEGRHSFAVYALILRLEPADLGRTRLRAETRAAFPGLVGAVYKRLVLGTGAHRAGVRRLLAAVRRRSEAPVDG
jgi:hypothetical protein